ncbi:MAG: putative oxygen-independent coproporphyrinogen III oxidase (hemN-like) [Rhodospirillaceae bacterium]|nr:MAG: putative oxygen-independent coproporphyrinogen III oxidase (hemN-like) [Rhodospirillaceae bacterium]
MPCGADEDSMGVSHHGEETPGIGLYVHWPFCVRKCPYCDFNSHVTARVDHERWRRALLGALDCEAARAPGRTLASVFFGGGTPSLMEPATVAAVLERALTHWSPAPTLEVTLEANPGTVDCDTFADFRAAGVNRLSLGVQALDDESLHRLDRIHDTAQAVAAIVAGQRIFPRVSFDLIYARPDQTLASWRRELEQALALAPEHLSLYQLTIEAGSALRAWRLPDEDTATDLYHLTQDMTAAAGLPAYEIANHARAGAECRHHLISWQGGEFVGIGPGAHGRVTDVSGAFLATCQHRSPKTWLARGERGDYGTSSAVSSWERVEEILLMGLRLTAGIARPLFQTLTGRTLEAVLDPSAVECLKGYLVLDEAGLRTTRDGRLVLNEILRQLHTK